MERRGRGRGGSGRGRGKFHKFFIFYAMIAVLMTTRQWLFRMESTVADERAVVIMSYLLLSCRFMFYRHSLPRIASGEHTTLRRQR